MIGPPTAWNDRDEACRRALAIMPKPLLDRLGYTATRARRTRQVDEPEVPELADPVANLDTMFIAMTGDRHSMVLYAIAIGDDCYTLGTGELNRFVESASQADVARISGLTTGASLVHRL